MFNKIREWDRIRTLRNAEPQMAYQRFMQEALEIHMALVKGNDIDFVDAVGDAVIALSNLATSKGLDIEDCIKVAFEEIDRRKGITMGGQFIRYAKLSDKDKAWCDEHQGNPKSDHYIDEPATFEKDTLL